MKFIVASKLMILLMTFFFVLTVHAEPEDNNIDPPTNDAPLDSGVSLLIAAGVGYALNDTGMKKEKRYNSLNQPALNILSLSKRKSII